MFKFKNKSFLLKFHVPNAYEHRKLYVVILVCSLYMSFKIAGAKCEFNFNRNSNPQGCKMDQ